MRNIGLLGTLIKQNTLASSGVPNGAFFALTRWLVLPRHTAHIVKSVAAEGTNWRELRLVLVGAVTLNRIFNHISLVCFDYC